jgi:SNF2 family DNA or RNA helicase
VMLNFDVRQYDTRTREGMAWRVHNASDFVLPELTYWNYSPCRQHANGWVEKFWDQDRQQERHRTVFDRPKPGCRHCGILFRQHQRVGIAWLYLRKRGLLADTMGTGKTVHAAGLLSLLHESGEIETVGRAIIIPRAAALGQWQNELLRMIPGLNLIMAQGTPDERKMLYASDWTTLLISPQTFNNDYDIFRQHFDLSLLLTDDIDALRNRDNETAKNIKTIARQSDRFVVMTGTPVQKHLREMWSTLEEVGGREAFGTQEAFEARHVTKVPLREYDERTGLLTATRMVPAYRNMNEVKEKMAPMVLRRKVEDLKDVNLPEVNVSDVFLDLYPAQRNKYEELRRGILRIMKEEGSQVKIITALTKLQYGAQICGGLATLGEPDGPNTSVKMDWIMDALAGDLEDEKVVLFVNYKNSVRALQDRFRRAGVGFETVWGEQPNRDARKRSQDRFWDDPKCRVLIGTQSIEQSLNLQISRHLINMDMIMNPKRMEQLAGRIRRDGSAHPHVFIHNLLTVNTQEQRYLPMLERESALADHIWDENNELFQALPPLVLMQLITG